jgi:hypothetical protein
LEAIAPRQKPKAGCLGRSIRIPIALSLESEAIAPEMAGPPAINILPAQICVC